MGKTATDLKNSGWPIEEMKKYRPWESSERYKKDRGVIERRARALNISRQIVRLLKEKYGATRVVLFGSLSHDAWFTPRSDIDICAEGIPVDQFSLAESEVQKAGEGFKIDLVEPDECSAELLRVIEKEGIDL